MTSTLPKGWTIDEEEEEGTKSKLPEGWSIDEPKDYRDVVSEDLRESGYEPEFSEELERASEQGIAEATRGLASGVSFGVTENIPGLKTSDNVASTTGKIIGSLWPLSKLVNVFEGPAMKLAAKSPILQKQLGSLATMFAVGSVSQGLETVAKGEIPNADDLLEHGIEWAALDALLQTAGVAGRFAKGLFSRAKATGVDRLELVNQINKELVESGVDMTNAEAVSAKALEILERPLSTAEQATGKQLEIAKKEQSQAEKIAQESLKPEKVTPKDLKTRKITDDPVNRLTKETQTLSEPYAPERADFRQEAEALEKDAIQEKIDSVGTRAATEEELGTSIKEDIEEQLEAKKSEYRPLYKEAEEAAEALEHIPQNTARVAGNKLKKIRRLSTKPEGYTGVIKNLENVLEDVGFVIQRDVEGNIEQIVSKKDVPVSDTIELARRLNEMVDYEAIEPTVKEALRDVVRAAKQDVRAGLAANPDALAAFELAEQAHAQTAKKFTKDNIRKIRGQQASEKIAKMAESPSSFGDLREVLSPKQMLQLEREMLEKLNNQTYEKASKQLREMERHLSAENKKLAQEIVEAKNPHNPNVKTKLTKDAILNDMSNAFTNGTRPEKTLGLWKTQKGQKLVKETFHNSPNWPVVKNYLEKQSFNDMVASVLKDGKIDLKKFKSFMKDPAAVNSIRSQGGEEAVTFFRNLDSQVNQLENNVKLLDKFPSKEQIEKGKKFVKESPGQKRLEKGVGQTKRLERETTKLGQEYLEKQVSTKKESTGERGSKILQRMTEKDFPFQAKTKKWREWFTETMGLNEKGLLSVFGLMKLGLPNTVASLVSYRMFNKMLTSPRVRKAFLDASKHQSNPLKFILAVENLGEALDE